MTSHRRDTGYGSGPLARLPCSCTPPLFLGKVWAVNTCIQEPSCTPKQSALIGLLRRRRLRDKRFHRPAHLAGNAAVADLGVVRHEGGGPQHSIARHIVRLVVLPHLVLHRHAVHNRRDVHQEPAPPLHRARRSTKQTRRRPTSCLGRTATAPQRSALEYWSEQFLRERLTR
eukprot:1196215-Prorocentrum_minimum.AAC.11